MLIFLHLAVYISTRCAIAVAHAHMHSQQKLLNLPWPIRARLTKIGCKITPLKWLFCTPLRISVFYSLKGVIGGALFFQFRFTPPRTPFISLCVERIILMICIICHARCIAVLVSIAIILLTSFLFVTNAEK